MRVSFCLILVLAMIASTSFAAAQETVSFTLYLQADDYDFSQAFIDYEIRSFVTEEVYFGGITTTWDGKAEFSLPPSFYEFIIFFDDAETQGFDYFGKVSSSIDISKNIPVHMFPVGSLRVIISDGAGKPIQNALVRIDCENNRGQQGYFSTDEFGMVEARFVPEGECVVRAAFEDFVISKNVSVYKGSKEGVSLVFSDYYQRKFSFWWIVVAFFVFASVAYAIFRGKKTYKIDSVGKKTTKEDIITALSDQEKKVVRFMLEEQEKSVVEGGRIRDFYLNQAKIIYGAKIPKTTLVRLLKGLENKQILIVENEGKIKKIRFSEWFRSK